MKYGNLVVVLCALAALGGCVVGQKHTLLIADPKVELAGEGPLAVSALDHRPYVVSGEKQVSFLGLLRNSVGVPFDINTEGRRAVSDEVATVLAGALEKAGFDVRTISTRPEQGDSEVIAAIDGQSRLALLTINELKSDTYARTRLQYDLGLKVFVANGELLAGSVAQGEDSLGAGFDTSKHTKDAVPAALSVQLERLINDPGVVEALR